MSLPVRCVTRVLPRLPIIGYSFLAGLWSAASAVKAQSGNDADLVFLEASGAPLTPAFSTARLSYTQTVPALQTALSVWPQQKDPNARVRVRIDGGPWVAVSPGTPLGAGVRHTLALRNDGTLAGWGSNSHGQLTIPPAAVQLMAVAASGAESVALKRDGGVLAWGWSEVNPVPAFAASGVVAVESSGGRVLALKQNGTLVAWGNPSYDGTTIPMEASSGVVAIAAADEHSLALLRDGSVFAWGLSANGKVNVPPEAKSGVIAVAAGLEHSLALKDDGSVVAWGAGQTPGIPPNFGQSIIPPAATAGVVAIAAGHYHSIALKADGSLIAWGLNRSGQTDVPAAATGVTAITAGDAHSVALKADGTVVAWGEDFPDILAIPAGLTGVSRVTAPPAAPALPLHPGLNTVEVTVTSASGEVTKTWTIRTTRPGAPEIAVFNGAGTVPADERTDNAGTVSFESANIGSQSPAQVFTIHNTGTTPLTGLALSILPGGDSADFTVLQPPPAELSPGITATVQIAFTPVAPGFRMQTLTILSNDADENPFRIVLSGTGVPPPSGNALLDFLAVSEEAFIPAFDPNVRHYTQTGTSAGFIVWPLATGTGAGVEVRLNGNAWRPVASGSPLSAGRRHLVAITEHGSVTGWGRNEDGESSTPVPASFGVARLATGGFHNLGLKEDGTLLAWGAASSNQINIPPAALTGSVSVAGGFSRSFALKRNGTLVNWGFGPSGSGTVPAAAAADIVAVSPGDEHTLALKRNGTVIAWGSNLYGQTTLPPEVLRDVMAISAGGLHSLALKTDGRVIAWGENGFGQSAVPSTALTGVVAIRGGRLHSLALKADGSVIAWGAGITVDPNDERHAGQAIVPPGALSGVTGIAAGGNISAALKADGSILTWGAAPSADITPPAALRSLRQPTAAPAVVLSGLTGGSNLIEVRVTAQDGVTTRTYTLSALRAEISLRDGATITAPELSDSQTTSVDFGRNIQGTPGVRSFTLSNAGSAPLNVSSLTIPAGYETASVPALPFTIAADASLTFQLRLTSLVRGTYAGSVTITSDDLDEAVFDFPVTGEVFIPDPVAGTINPATTLNRQSGLREQTIRVANDTTAAVPAYNLIISGLPAGVEINNASSTRPDGSVVVYIRQPLEPHSTQDIVIEYYSANRSSEEMNPRLLAEVVLPPLDLSVPAGDAVFVIGRVERLAAGAMLIEFPSTPGRTYQVQYSGDGKSWQSSLPSIRAAGNRTQWIDRGLPRTDSHPTQSADRWYRVKELAP